MFEKEKLILGVNKSKILKETDRFWMVTSGKVDVYFVKIGQNDSFESSLTYLYRAEKGELLFSLQTVNIRKEYKLLLVSEKASLISVNKNKLLNIEPIFLKQLIDKWVLKTSKEIYNYNPPRNYFDLNAFGEIPIDDNKYCYPSKGLVWCKLEKGELLILNKTLTLKDSSKYKLPFPVSSNLYLKTTSKGTKIQVLSTQEILKDEIFFMLSFNELQENFLLQLIKNKTQQLQKESTTIKERLNIENQELEYSLKKLKSILSDEGINLKRVLEHQETNSVNNVLFQACQCIGNEVNYTFELPKFEENYRNSTTSALYAIAQASKVRLRKIILRGVWWKEENGHLLGFLKEDKTPVALIQKKPGQYLLINPKTQSKTIVNNEVVETLDPTCYMFFYGFENQMTSVKRIWNYAAQGIKKDFKYLIIAALAGSLIGLLVPVLSGILFDDVIPTADRALLVEVGIILLVIGVASAGLQLTEGILQMRVETKSSINMQAGVMDHLLRLPVTFFNKFTAGDLTNRTLSINSIKQIVSNTVMTAVLSGAFSFINLILLFYYQSSLAWIGVGLAFVAILFMLAIGWKKLKFDRLIADVQGELQGFLFEFISGISKIRIIGAEKRIFSLWANKFSKLKSLSFQSGSYQNFVETFNNSYPLLTNIFFFSFIYYSISQLGVTSTISIGAFMAFISAFNQFLKDCLRMTLALTSSLNVITLYERVKPILEEIPESNEQSNDPGEISGEIEMNAVSFRYNEEQPLVLKNISFKIKPGEMVAFVGASGSGKSTIMRMLLGFEQPEIGSIFYDGKEFSNLSKDLVRRQIGVVLQNGALMPGSIFKNIVGNSQLTLKDAWRAAKMAGMEEDIKQMPMEMHTVISEGAGTFSGGQRQRLMIARAIAHKPRLLFMDEATSALDNRTQNIVSQSLDKLQATRIIIAHRLSTIINADRIYVMDKGQIIEQGTYSELLEKDGLFTKLAKRQLA